MLAFVAHDENAGQEITAHAAFAIVAPPQAGRPWGRGGARLKRIYRPSLLPSRRPQQLGLLTPAPCHG